jgi:hypothetical protein
MKEECARKIVEGGDGQTRSILALVEDSPTVRSEEAS